jgi:hypothetical protein
MYILGTETMLDEISADGEIKLGIHKVNQMYYRQIHNVWVHTNVFNDDMQSIIQPTPEKEAEMVDENAELRDLLEQLLNMKNIYCILTGRHALWSVTELQKETDRKQGHTEKDWVAQMESDYKYGHENQHYKVHVQDMLFSLQKLPAAMLLMNEKIGPFFEAYIPLFLERRILLQPSPVTSLSCQQYGDIWNMTHVFDSFLRDDEQTLVVDFHTRQLTCDIEFCNSIDTLIEDMRKFMYIRSRLLEKIHILQGNVNSNVYTNAASNSILQGRPVSNSHSAAQNGFPTGSIAPLDVSGSGANESNQ